ncbi:ribonuclease HII [Bifidobacterium sp.]|uniref:ribonuclease HII n=1 Tax=Bifidobacterium sp. TaxID=41200 RepID=UPI0039E9BADD
MSSESSRAKATVHAVPTLEMERSIGSEGFDLIIGLDEVGRGSLAGPVMVGAASLLSASLRDHDVPEGLADSKMLSPQRRERLVAPLRAWTDTCAIGSASNREIDQLGISHALGLAALRAICAVEKALNLQSGSGQARVAAILDGPFDYVTKALNAFDTPDVSIIPKVFTKIRADSSCATVAAASVLAKVRRDAVMTELSLSSPEYAPFHWEHNKGYGSAAHREAIRKFGPSDLHRVTWHLL